MPSARTRTSTSATNIILRFTWKPAHTSGSATRKLCGLKNALRTSWNACTGRPPGSVYSLLERRDLREVQVEALRLELRDPRVLRDQHTLVRVQVRSREVDRPLAGGGDRRLLEGDVEVLRARREELRPRRVDVLHRRDAELLRDRLREVDLVALRVLDRASADRADREANGRVAEADDQD